MEKLFEAIKSKDLAGVSAELNSITDINAMHNGETALTVGAAVGDVEIIQALLSAGANKDIQNQSKKSPESIAMASGKIAAWKMIKDFMPEASSEQKIDMDEIFNKVHRLRSMEYLIDSIDIIFTPEEEEIIHESFQDERIVKKTLGNSSKCMISTILALKYAPNVDFLKYASKHGDDILGAIFYVAKGNWENKRNPILEKTMHGLIENNHVNLGQVYNVLINLDRKNNANDLECINLYKKVLFDLSDNKFKDVAKYAFEDMLYIQTNNKIYYDMTYAFLEEAKLRGINSIYDIGTIPSTAPGCYLYNPIGKEFIDHFNMLDKLDLAAVALTNSNIGVLDELMKIGIKPKYDYKMIVEQMLGINRGLERMHANGFTFVSHLESYTYTEKTDLIRTFQKHGLDLSTIDFEAIYENANIQSRNRYDRAFTNELMIMSVALDFGKKAGFIPSAEKLADDFTQWHEQINKSKYFGPMFNPYSVIPIVLKEYGDINAKNSQGLTPLMVAAKHADRHMIAGLLDEGADPEITDDKGLNSFAHLGKSRKVWDKEQSAMVFAKYMEEKNSQKTGPKSKSLRT